MSDRGMEFRGVALRFLELVAPFCERVEIAGSIRRGKAEPKDIEIVAMPKVVRETRVVNLFGDSEEYEVDELHEQLTRWRCSGDLASRGAWGERHKRIAFEGAPIDLFCVKPPASWGVIFALRTGPGDFNQLAVTSRLCGGGMPTGMQVKAGALWRLGQVVETREEADYFREIDIPCWPPPERTIERLKGYLSTRRVSA